MDESGGETSLSALPKIKTLKEFMDRKNLIKSKILCDTQISDQLRQLKPKVICKPSEISSFSKHLEEKLRELTNFEVISKITDEIPNLKSENNVIDLDFEPKILNIKKVKLSNGFNLNHGGKKPDSKPECSYIKLKKNLKRLVTQRREIEIKRKFEKNCVKKDEVNTNKLNKENEEEKMDEDEEEKMDDDEEENEEELEHYSDVDEEQDEEEEENNEDVDENCESKNEEASTKDAEIEAKNEKASNDHQSQSVNDEIGNENYLTPNISGIEKSHLNSKINEVFISQIPNTSISEDDENDLVNLCSGKFTNTQNNYPDSQSSDDEDDDISPPWDTRQKKMKKRPVISDESDESDDENNNLEEIDSESGDRPGNGVEVYIDYDSEENEVEVKITKDDRQKQAAEFFENEAELSESEWGSDDEDEKDLDKYDIELGDEDKFDQDELHRDLEKIHMRKLLDEDMRDLKKIQEMFFDDEENDGIGRQRQFKWKNIENNNLISKNCDDDNLQNENADNDDAKNEEFYRKTRYEREQILKEKLNEQSDEKKMENLQLTSKKLTIIKSKNYTTSDNSSDHSFLISQIGTHTTGRSSFLTRDKQTISKLTSLVKANNEDNDEDEIICIRPKSNRKTLFSIVEKNNER